MTPDPDSTAAGFPRSIRLGYLVSHPIQYQAPLLRRIAREPDIDLTVLFGSDFSARGYQDQGFGVEVAWDTPLLEGYRSEVLPALRDTGTVSFSSPLSRNLYGRLRRDPRFDALWVHGYASLNSLQAIFAARLLGIPVLLRAESWLADRPRAGWKLAAKTLFLRALRPSIAATLPIGSLNAAYWRHYFGDDFPQFPMPYAVDNAWFAERSRAAAPLQNDLRSELGLTPDRPVILFAAKLQPRKNAADLIEAYRRFRGSFSPDRAPYLVIAGDGEERARLEELCRNLPDVRFAGFRNQTELPRFFDLADVFVLPSRHEPWGLVVNEAMAAGCAVIVSTDAGCHADLITTGVEGRVFPTGDIAALTAALHSVFASPEISRNMGQAAARRIATWSFEEDVGGLRQALAFATRHPPVPDAEATLRLLS